MPACGMKNRVRGYLKTSSREPLTRLASLATLSRKGRGKLQLNTSTR